MGQSMCGGVREEPKRTLDLGIFDNSKHFCANMRKGSPYFKRRIRKAERKVQNAKNLYENYKEAKNARQESKVCKNRRIRSNSN